MYADTVRDQRTIRASPPHFFATQFREGTKACKGQTEWSTSERPMRNFVQKSP